MNERTKQIPVTVVVPVKNEEANLERCLVRLSAFPEVVVVDSGSTDRTQQIASSFGARVEVFEWNGRYPKKRNWMLLNAPPKQPWVLFLDADELIDDDFLDELASVIDSSNYTGFWLNYSVYFLNKRLRFGVQQRKLALFKVGKGLYEKIEEDNWSQLDMEIHEHPVVDGPIGEIRSQIDHRDYNGLGKFIEKHRDYALWEARRYKSLAKDSDVWRSFTKRQKFKYKNLEKWWFPWFYFVFTYLIKFGILDGGAGFNYAYFKAWYFQSIRLLIKENDA